MSQDYEELITLSDSGQIISEGDADIRGMSAKDVNGEDLGKVDDLLVDTSEKKVRFLVVASGGFLGLGEHKSFLPVDAIARIADDEVHIDQTREHLAGAPAYDPELVNDRSYSEDVFGYYGYGPYWGIGYQYPNYPSYR